MREGIILTANGIAGNNIAVSTNVCSIQNVGPGRWKIWGRGRHTLEDGLKLIVGATPIYTRIPQGPNATTDFGPFMIDILNATDDIVLQLAVATGAADTASGILYAQSLTR